MKSRGLPIHVILLLLLVGSALSLPARAAIDADAAIQKAAAVARALNLPWGEQVEVEKQPAEGEVRERWVVKHFDFAEITLDAADGSVVIAHNRSALAEWGARPTTVNLSKEEALVRATEIAETLGFFSEPAAVHDVELRRYEQGGTRALWAIRWVRTASGIPYARNMAILKLHPETGKFIGAGKAFWSRPPESTEVHMEESAALAAARQHARALGITEADVSPTVELQVVQPNNYWKRTRDYGSEIALPYPGYSRVAWAVTIKQPSTLGGEGAVFHKLFWIDALDGKLLGGTKSLGPVSPAPAAAKTAPAPP